MGALNLCKPFLFKSFSAFSAFFMCFSTLLGGSLPQQGLLYSPHREPRYNPGGDHEEPNEAKPPVRRYGALHGEAEVCWGCGVGPRIPPGRRYVEGQGAFTVFLGVLGPKQSGPA